MARAIVELRDLGAEELVERLESSKEELFNLRFQLATGQLDNPMRIKDLRHDVARILTVLRERDLEAEIEQTGASTAPRAAKPVEPAKVARSPRATEPAAGGPEVAATDAEPALAADEELAAEEPSETATPAPARRRLRRKKGEDT